MYMALISQLFSYFSGAKDRKYNLWLLQWTYMPAHLHSVKCFKVLTDV